MATPRLGKEDGRRSVDANPYFRFDPQSKHIEDAVFGCRGIMAGWGRFETSDLRMSRGDIEGGMTVMVRDSFFASATKSETGNPSCFFVSGLLAGIADGLFGQSHNCMEKECKSAGSECCEFVVTAV